MKPIVLTYLYKVPFLSGAHNAVQLFTTFTMTKYISATNAARHTRTYRLFAWMSVHAFPPSLAVFVCLLLSLYDFHLPCLFLFDYFLPSFPVGLLVSYSHMTAQASVAPVWIVYPPLCVTYCGPSVDCLPPALCVTYCGPSVDCLPPALCDVLWPQCGLSTPRSV